MIGELHKAERFMEDVKKCDQAIEQLADGVLKEDAKKLLNQLIFEVKKMDNLYMDMIYNHQLGTTDTEFRERILNIRKNLYSILKIK